MTMMVQSLKMLRSFPLLLLFMIITGSGWLKPKENASPSLLSVVVVAAEATYEPTWESLDTRPLPSWYDEAKIGIFVHWGVFSVPAFQSEWFWYYWEGPHEESSGGDDNNNNNKFEKFIQQTEKPGFAYADYAHRFE